MKLKEFKKGCNTLLLETFESKYPVYGTETLDGYKRPSFFTELLPRTWRRLSKNITEVGLTYKVTFLETTHDEALCLGIVASVIEAFGWTIKAAGLTWICETIDYDFVNNTDVLQITIDFATIRTVTVAESTTGLIESVLLDLEIYSPNHELMGKETHIITKENKT